MSFLENFFLLFLSENKNQKRTNRGSPRVSGAREQCKKHFKIDSYFILFVTEFCYFCETHAITLVVIDTSVEAGVVDIWGNMLFLFSFMTVFRV